MENRRLIVASKHHDPMITTRVKQYLEENVHQTYVDVDDMTRDLQNKYREYNRRKFQPFRYTVDQAYKSVLRSYGLSSNNNTSEDDDGNSDLEMVEDRPSPPSILSNALNSMYAAGPSGSVGRGTNAIRNVNNEDNSAPIDISSDDDDDGNNAATNHASINAQPTPPVSALRLLKDLTVVKRSIQEVEKSEPPQTQQDQNEGHVIKYSSQSSKRRKLDPANANESLLKPRIEKTISAKPAKKMKKEFTIQSPRITFSNIGGIEKILRELCELMLHIKHPEIYKHIGLPPPRGFLLHGPPGSGKTMLAQAIAGQLDVGIIEVAATELVTGVSGESEERIRDLFEQAAAAAPCVLFIDEIDAISSNRVNASKDMERRIVAQLLVSIDGLSKFERGAQVLVIGATNRVEVLDPALRRVGRFDQEICLGIPDRDARCHILRVICKDLKLAPLFDFEQIATLTPGYVGADLLALATRAASLAIKRAYNRKQDSALRSSINSTKQHLKIPSVNLSQETLLQVNNGLEKVIELDAEMDVDEAVKLAEGEDGESLGGVPLGKEIFEDITPAVAVDTDADVLNKEKTVAIPAASNGHGEDVSEGKTDKLNTSSEKKSEKPTENEEVSENRTCTESNSTSHKEPQTEKTDNVITVADSSNANDGSLSDALLQNNNIKQTLSLDVMLQWLNNVNPLMTQDELNSLFITMDDFKDACKLIQPSAKREGFITVPDVTWDDIGSLQDIRQELQLAILAPIKYPNRLKILGLQSPSGVLLCGPPGCGKTLLAKAVANEAGVNFISVKGPELLNMYVGESERAVRQCFQRARNSAPCVIFFDEFDALCPKRSDSNEGGASARVVNQLLTEMDGVEDRKGVFLMAATNRPDMVDAAVLRPGRLDKILYVGLPEEVDRRDILKAITKAGTQPILADDVNIEELAQLTESYTGADLAGLVRQASLQALKNSIVIDGDNDSSDAALQVHNVHFTQAIKNLRPSVTPQDKIRYEKLRSIYAISQQAQ